jgi:hypothetical protein
MPRTIKVGPIIYNIQQANMSDEGEMTPEGVMNINKNLIDPKQELAIIHEVVEIINGEYQLDLPHPKIMTIGYAFYQFIKDNPEVFK